MKISKSFFVFLLLGVSSCTNYYSEVSDNSTQINVNLLGDNESVCDTLYLSSFVESESLVPLENSDECIIGMIRDIKMYKDLIFISQYQQRPLLVFNSKGEFLNKIGNIGRGRGEYLETTSFDINPSTGQVSILDNTNKRISKYNQKGEFEGSFLFDDYPQDMSVTPNGDYVFYDPMYQFSEYNSGIWITDQNGALKKKLLSFGKKVKWSSGLFPRFFVRSSNGQISLVAKDNKIYSVENDEISALYGINVDIKISKKIRKQSFIDKYEPYSAYAIMNYFNTDRFIFFSVMEMNGMDGATVIVDKVEGQRYYIDKKHPFVFDHEYGVVPFFSNSGNKLIGIIDPSEIVSSDSYKEIFPGYDLNSNPVLLIYNMKR